MAYYTNGSQNSINDYIVPFILNADVTDQGGITYRRGTQFSYNQGTEIKTTLNIRSLHNMFQSEVNTIDTVSTYGIQPYEYLNRIRALAGMPQMTSPAGLHSNGAAAHIIPQTTPTKNPNVRTSAAVRNNLAGSSSAPAPKTKMVGQDPIKKIYCPYNADVIVYDAKNNRVDELCGELTISKFRGIMGYITKTTTFDGFEYFKEACFELGVINRTNELENDDYAALEAMKLYNPFNIDDVKSKFAE